jgi:hypothetical protein
VEYAVRTVAEGREFVVMVRAGAATVMVSGCVAVVFDASFTWTVKVDAPGAVGVPAIVAPLRLRPAGSEPDTIDQVLPPDPPVAARVAAYGAPTAPAGSDVVVIVRAGGATVIESGLVAVLLAESLTWTVKLDVPAVVGVPEMAEPFSVSPAGSVPEAIDQMFPPAPPVELKVAEYGVPTVAGGSEDVVIASAGVAGAAIAIESGLLAVAFDESVTWTVKFDVPADVGVPEIVEPLSVRPAGSDPAGMLQV